MAVVGMGDNEYGDLNTLHRIVSANDMGVRWVDQEQRFRQLASAQKKERGRLSASSVAVRDLELGSSDMMEVTAEVPRPTLQHPTPTRTLPGISPVVRSAVVASQQRKATIVIQRWYRMRLLYLELGLEAGVEEIRGIEGEACGELTVGLGNLGLGVEGGVGEEEGEELESFDEESDDDSSSDDDDDTCDDDSRWIRKLVRVVRDERKITCGVSKADGRMYTLINGLSQGALVPDSPQNGD